MKKKLMIGIPVSVIIIIGLVFFNNIMRPSDMKANWKSIEDDFEIINEIVLEHNQSMSFNEFEEMLNDEQKIHLNNASEYYSQYNCYHCKITFIKVDNGMVGYYDWEGKGVFSKIVYSKYSKRKLKKLYNTSGRHYNITVLGDNWYYLHEHHI